MPSGFFVLPMGRTLTTRADCAATSPNPDTILVGTPTLAWATVLRASSGVESMARAKQRVRARER